MKFFTSVFKNNNIGDRITVRKRTNGETSNATVFGFLIATVFGKISQKINTTKLTTKVDRKTPHLSPKKVMHKLVVIAVAAMLTTLFPNKIILKKRSGWLLSFLTVFALIMVLAMIPALVFAQNDKGAAENEGKEHTSCEKGP